MNLRYTKLYRVYLASSIYLSLKIWTRIFQEFICNQVQKEKEKLLVSCSRPP